MCERLFPSWNRYANSTLRLQINAHNVKVEVQIGFAESDFEIIFSRQNNSIACNIQQKLLILWYRNGLIFYNLHSVL